MPWRNCLNERGLPNTSRIISYPTNVHSLYRDAKSLERSALR